MDIVSSKEKEWTEVIKGFNHKTLAHGDKMSMQKFEIEPKNKYGSKHKHKNAQIGYVIEGKGLYYVSYKKGDGKIKSEIMLEPGDSVYIPSGEYHNAINRGDEVVYGIDVFCPPRVDPAPSYMTS
jgi:quercetin dioxygenase-like cupin family protein